MKKVYTLLLAFAALLTANAQDASNWQEGQDVTAALGFGDADGTWSGTPNESNGDYWKGSIPTEYEVNNGIGVMGFYFDGKSTKPMTNIYQVVKVPAGTYSIKAQALYREGTPYDSFMSFFKGFPKKNVHLYATVLTSEDPESEAVRDFSKPIRSLADSEQTEQLCTEADQDWKKDANGTKTNEDGTTTTYYCPCSLLGASLYFLNGRYENELKIILLQDAYVRIGLRQTARIAQDWIPFTNFRIIYNGPADEKAQIEAAKSDCEAAIDQMYELQARVTDAGFEGFAGAIGDAAMKLDDEVFEAATLQDLDALLIKIGNTYDSYNKSLAFVLNLSELLEMSADMLASTSFPGLAEFQAVYDKAAAAATTTDVEVLGDDPAAYFQNVFNELSKGRADYLNSQEADETGAKDFSGLIKYPWFVNPEFTPTHNDDGTWTLTEETWSWGSVGNPGAYASTRDNGGRTDICSKVELSADEDVQNQWFKYVNVSAGWSPGLSLFYQSGLIGVSDGWNSVSGGTQEIRQQLAGLPNGYYSVKALARGYVAGGSWTGEYHNIFAQNSAGEIVKSPVGKTDSDYPESATYGWYEWNPAAWQEHKTSIIQAPDGKLLIGSQTGMVGDFTGFRLMYYGEQPAFTAMLQEDIDECKKKAAELTFKGDIKKVEELLAQIVLPVTSAEAYEAALVPLREANDYIKRAVAAVKNLKAVDTFTGLLDQYLEADEQAMLQPAFEYAIALGEGENDTYELVDAANEAATAYSDYMSIYAQAVALKDAYVDKVLATQVAELKAGYKDAATVKGFLDALALPYNNAMFTAKGADKATEANPVDVSFLINNPDFVDSPSKGWTGETPTQNQYGVEVVTGVKIGEAKKGLNAELWNKSAFTLSQKIANLPAGTYELRVQALYRDGGAVTQDLVDAFNAAGSEDAWANHNAQLFARVDDNNDQFVYIKAIESLKATEPSFSEGGFDLDEGSSEVDENDNLVSPVYKENLVIDADAPGYPFDTKIGDYYYPASMYGFYAACQKDANAFANAVRITINGGETIEIGIRKTAAIGSDWVIFDNFQLVYLTGDTFVTGISTVAAPRAKGAIYNLAGQRVTEDYKGIIIQDGVKKLNK